jgi:hypothetical protein
VEDDLLAGAGERVGRGRAEAGRRAGHQDPHSVQLYQWHAAKAVQNGWSVAALEHRILIRLSPA